ncbi:oxygenase MpaB family protein [Streptomyces chartreusis]|uniref:oxygenase MpaB family protein n=1 Tax=Streptomyces chartreusis TaxID=1969 RepID=UPI00380C4333
MTAPEFPGPGSLSWQHYGRRRVLAAVLRLLVLQTAHPMIGAAVTAHSSYGTDFTGRARRTLLSMETIIYGSTALRTGEIRRLNRMHTRFTGLDNLGRRYDGLNPEARLWVAITLLEHLITTAQLLGQPLNKHEQHDLHREWLDLTREFGIASDLTPHTLAEFRTAFIRHTTNILENTIAARTLLDARFLRTALPSGLGMPAPVAIRLTEATLSADLARRLDLRVSEWQRAEAHTLYRALGAAEQALPDRLAYFPHAYKAVKAGRPW